MFQMFPETKIDRKLKIWNNIQNKNWNILNKIEF